jgi:LacI family transcriptional regulator
MKVYTIKEIAKLAGVSAGTVDRVLHKRGKVSPDKEEKVNALLRKIDYKPNLLARSLKMNKRHQLVAVLPNYHLDEYWKPCFDGIKDLRRTLEEIGVFVEVLKYDPGNPLDFRDICDQCIAMQPDGVLLGALFLKESSEFLDALERKTIPFNLFNTPLEGASTLVYVGQDLVQSGRIAAHLFDMILPKQRSFLIVHIAEDFENAFHMQQKEKGFRSYFEADENVKIRTINIKADEGKSYIQKLKDLDIEQVNGIFVTTSKAHLVAKDNTGIPIIGYDLLEENINSLKDGKIKFLIYQNPRMQAYMGLSLLADFLVKDQQSPRQKFLPIEIISPENVNSYLEMHNLRSAKTYRL